MEREWQMKLTIPSSKAVSRTKTCRPHLPGNACFQCCECRLCYEITFKAEALLCPKIVAWLVGYFTDNLFLCMGIFGTAVALTLLVSCQQCTSTNRSFLTSSLLVRFAFQLGQCTASTQSFGCLIFLQAQNWASQSDYSISADTLGTRIFIK